MTGRDTNGTPDAGIAVEQARRLAAVVRRHRAATSRSLGELSRATGLSKTSLSRIENAEANPSLETLWRLGRALNLSIGQLFDGTEPASLRVLRAGEGPVVRSSTGMHGRLLRTDSRPHRTEVFELDLPDGAQFDGEAHPPGTTEVVYCAAGRVCSGPVGDVVTLETGDSVEFDGSTPHVYAAGPGGGRAVLVMSYPPS
ncbi:XRE family transcriptional regulator [Actinomycetes bacterium KLBMP 9759]